MGYRSEVAYLVEFEDREQMEGFVATQVVAGNVESLDLFKISEIGSGRWQLVYHEDYIKWYPDYEDVQMHERFMKCAIDVGYPVDFVRIGENDEDIESRFSGNSAYKLEVYRYITIPVGFEGEKPFSFTKKEAERQPQ